MTSGTTGNPKGIVHSLRGLSERIASNIAYIGGSEMERSLCVLPLFFGHGLIGNCLTPLAAGGTLHLWSGPQIHEIRELGEVIDRHGITFMSSVPSFWKLAARMSGAPTKPPLRIHVGSAPLSIEQWNAIARWGRHGQCPQYVWHDGNSQLDWWRTFVGGCGTRRLCRHRMGRALRRFKRTMAKFQTSAGVRCWCNPRA